MRTRTMFIAVVASAVVAVVWSQGRGNPTEWPTAYGDAQHTSWIRTDAHISPETMSQSGFELQWKTTLESPVRHGVSLTQGVVASAVNLFTPLSTVAGPANHIFAIDNDTGNLFWTRHFDGPLGPGTAACPGGVAGAPTRIANLVVSPPAAGRGRRGGQAYRSAVGEPGAGVPIAPSARGGGGRGTAPATPPAGASPGAAPAAAPAPAPAAPAPPPPSPFPTNVAASRGGGGLFRPSGVVYAVSADGMFRTLGLVSGKDVQRPAPFLPAGARFSDLIGVGDMIYTATSQRCGGAANGIWAISASGDPKSVVSWKTNGGDPIGSVAFATNGTVIAAIGPGTASTGGHVNAIVALDPKTLALKDWFTQPGVEFVAAPVIFHESGKDIVAATSKDGRILLLDVASLGGASHATPLFASASLTGGAATFAAQSPAMWRERMTVPPEASAATGPAAGTPAAAPAAPQAPVVIDGARWLLVPVAGRLPAATEAAANGPVTTGAILAVRVAYQTGTFSVQPGWVSENVAAPRTPIVVNGVVFAASGPANAAATLYALNGATGKTLWQSARTISSPLSGQSLWTGSGHVFAGTLDGTVYAFGFAMERK